IQGAGNQSKPLRPGFLQPQPHGFSKTDNRVRQRAEDKKHDGVRSDSCRRAQHLMIEMPVRIDVEEIQRMLRRPFYVAMSQTEQNKTQSQAKQPFARLKNGDAAQPEMLDQKAFSFVHEWLDGTPGRLKHRETIIAKQLLN